MLRTPHTLNHLRTFRGRIYLVGGWVRDSLLGIRSQDVDFLIEGSRFDYQRALNVIKRRFPPVAKTLEFFPEFGTMRWIAKDGYRIDCARPRTEFYEQPGVLPRVRLIESAQDDLRRRDYAANAVAYGVSAPVLGNWLDLFGGRRDIERRQLKVLHDASFHDDPTRMMRGIRLGVRLGFKFEPKTRHLLQKALRDRVLATVSWTRFRDEYLKALDEACWDRVRREHARYGIEIEGMAISSPASMRRALQNSPSQERLATLYFWYLLHEQKGAALSRKEWPSREFAKSLSQLERLSGGRWRPSEMIWPLTMKILDHVKPQWAAALRRPRPVFIDGSDLQSMNIPPTERGSLMLHLYQMAFHGKLKNRRQAIHEVRRWI